MKTIALKMIKFYQTHMSPNMTSRCRFSPSCSEYVYMAIDRFGFFRGGFIGLWRLLRCNPFSQGGYDPVPQRKGINVK